MQELADLVILPKKTDINYIFRRPGRKAAKIEAQEPKLLDQLADESQDRETVYAWEPYLQYLLDNKKITPETYLKFKEGINAELTRLKATEGLTFDSPNALELTNIANEALSLFGKKYTCRVGILKKGSHTDAFVLPDGTIIFSQALINQCIDSGDPDAAVGAHAHETGHIINETAASVTSVEAFLHRTALKAVHEGGTDGIVPFILSRLHAKTDLLERFFAIDRKLLLAKRQEGATQKVRTRGIVHQSHLSRESAQVLLRSKLHLKGGDRHFHFAREEVIPTNTELLREQLTELQPVTYQDLVKLSTEDINRLFRHELYAREKGEFELPQPAQRHKEAMKRSYVLGLARAHGMTLSAQELVVIEIALENVTSFKEVLHSPDEILALLRQINTQEFVNKLHTIVTDSRISYAQSSDEIYSMSRVIQSIISECDAIYDKERNLHPRNFSPHEITELFDFFDHFPFLSQYTRESGYVSIMMMLMATLQHDQNWDDSKIKTYRELIKRVSQRTKDSSDWCVLGKEMVENDLENVFFGLSDDVPLGFIELLKSTYREMYGREIDYKPPAVVVDWEVLGAECSRQFESIAGESDPKRVIDELKRIKVELQAALKQNPYGQAATLQEVRIFFDVIVGSVSEVLRDVLSKVDVNQYQVEFTQLLVLYKSMYESDSWLQIEATQDEHERAQKARYQRERKAACVIEYQNIVVDFSSQLSLTTLHQSLDSFQEIVSDINKLSGLRVEPDIIANHHVWQVLQERYQQEFPLQNLDDFLRLEQFLDGISNAYFRVHDIYKDGFYQVAVLPYVRERLHALIVQSEDKDLPVIIQIINSLVGTNLFDTLGLVTQLRWRYLRSDSPSVSFEDKCQFWIQYATYLHESGLNELSRQAKTPEHVNLLLDIAREKIDGVLAGKSEQSQMSVLFLADLVLELIRGDSVLTLLESCLPNNTSSSTSIAKNWALYHRGDIHRTESGNWKGKTSGMHLLSRFGHFGNLTIKQLMSIFKNLPDETKIGLAARFLSGDASPLLTEEGRNRLEDLICQVVGESGTTTALVLRGVVHAEDQAYLVHILSQALGPSLFRGLTTTVVRQSEVARSISSNRVEAVANQVMVRQMLDFDEMEVEKPFYTPYIINPQFERSSLRLNDQAFALEQSIKERFLQENDQVVSTHGKFTPSDRVKVLEKTGAHLVKGMQIGSQLLPNLEEVQRAELADSNDSMQAVSEYWFLANLHELAKTDPRVQKFVNSIVEYGGAHPEGLYVGGGSLFSVYRVKVRLDDGAERWVVVKMIRPEASDFNQRSIRFVDNVLENASQQATRGQRKQLRLLSFISQVAGRWTEEEIRNENNLDLEAQFRAFVASSGLEDVGIPELILTTDELRVEFEVDGRTLNYEMRTETSLERKIVLLEKFLEFIELQLQALDICHPDPHFGNLIVEPNNNDRFNIIDINRLINLSDGEKEVFRVLIQGDSRKFLSLFVELFHEGHEEVSNFALSDSEVNRLTRTITQRILANRVKGIFNGGSNPFLELQLLIESLVEFGMRAEDFKVDWQLLFRMVALRDTVKQQLRDLKQQ